MIILHASHDDAPIYFQPRHIVRSMDVKKGHTLVWLTESPHSLSVRESSLDIARLKQAWNCADDYDELIGDQEALVAVKLDQTSLRILPVWAGIAIEID